MLIFRYFGNFSLVQNFKVLSLTLNCQNIKIKLNCINFQNINLCIKISAGKTSNWLLRATVNLHSFEQCKDFIKLGGKNLIETQFCAIGYKGGDACQGDSGGKSYFYILVKNCIKMIVLFPKGPLSYTISK